MGGIRSPLGTGAGMTSFNKKRYEQSKLDHAIIGVYTCPYHAMQATKGEPLSLESAQKLCPSSPWDLFILNTDANNLRNQRRKSKKVTESKHKRLHTIMRTTAEINDILCSRGLEERVKIITLDEGIHQSKLVPGRDKYGRLEFLAVFPRLLDGNNWTLDYSVDAYPPTSRELNVVNIWATSDSELTSDMSCKIMLNYGSTKEHKLHHEDLCNKWQELLDVEVRGIKPTIVVRGFEDDSW